MIPTYLNQAPKMPSNQDPFVTIVAKVCEKSDPPPLFCELPDDLKFRADYHVIGTAQTYTYTSNASTITSSGIGTSTSTTTTF